MTTPFGTCLNEPSQQILVTRLLKTARVTTIATLPGIEISARVRPDGEKVYIVINHNATECPSGCPGLPLNS